MFHCRVRYYRAPRNYRRSRRHVRDRRTSRGVAKFTVLTCCTRYTVRATFDSRGDATTTTTCERERRFEMFPFFFFASKIRFIIQRNPPSSRDTFGPNRFYDSSTISFCLRAPPPPSPFLRVREQVSRPECFKFQLRLRVVLAKRECFSSDFSPDFIRLKCLNAETFYQRIIKTLLTHVKITLSIESCNNYRVFICGSGQKLFGSPSCNDRQM